MKKEGNFQFSSGRKQKALNAIASLLSFVVGFGISFFLSPFLLRTLGKEAYSYYPLSTSITNAMTVISSAMNSMASRFITISLLQGKKEEAEKYYSSTLFVDFLYSAVLVVFTIFFIFFLNRFINVSDILLGSVRLLFTFTIAAAIVNILSTVFGVATFATNRIELRSGREIALSLLRAGLFIAFYYLLPPNLSYIGIVALIIALVSLVIQWIFTKKLLPLSFKRTNISKSHVKEIFFSSLWVSINSLGNILLAGVTLIVINKFYSPEIGSIVSLAMTIPNLLSGIITTLAGLYYPLITKNVSGSDYKGLQANVRRYQFICGILCCAIITVFLAFSESFYQLWVPTEDASLLSKLSFITLAPYIFTSFFWIATYSNTATNDVKIPAIFMVAAGALNVGVQILLAALHVDWSAIVISCSLIQVVYIAVFLPLYLAKTTHTRWFDYYLVPIKILGLSFLSFGLAYAIKSSLTVNSWFKFILFGGGTGILSLLMYAFGMFLMDKNQLSQLWQIDK